MRATALLPVLCAALLGTTAWSAHADDLVVNEGQDSIRFTDAACSNEAVLNRIEPAARALFRTASATLQGQRYTACWSVVSSAVVLVYEDGDQGLVPMSKLKVPVDI
ncbi:hypothetical protein [Pseudorhodoferax sp.]|uniref:hypothetical protein n=1 Tax=Pseudorhodoferax sp. TaxID=1993553 RepID=UPI002DD64933|nr:hypothetical protein [Pseudorhodoferax sp.]